LPPPPSSPISPSSITSSTRVILKQCGERASKNALTYTEHSHNQMKSDNQVPSIAAAASTHIGLSELLFPAPIMFPRFWAPFTIQSNLLSPSSAVLLSPSSHCNDNRPRILSDAAATDKFRDALMVVTFQLCSTPSAQSAVGSDFFF